MNTSCYLLQTTVLASNDAYLKLLTYDYGVITVLQKRYKKHTLDYLHCYDILLERKKQHYVIQEIAINTDKYKHKKHYHYIHSRLLLQSYIAKYVPENVICQDVYTLFEELLETDYTPHNASMECVLLAHILHLLHPQELFDTDKKRVLMYNFCCRNSYSACQMYEKRASDNEWDMLAKRLLMHLSGQ